MNTFFFLFLTGVGQAEIVSCSGNENGKSVTVSIAEKDYDEVLNLKYLYATVTHGSRKIIRDVDVVLSRSNGNLIYRDRAYPDKFELNLGRSTFGLSSNAQLRIQWWRENSFLAGSLKCRVSGKPLFPIKSCNGKYSKFYSALRARNYHGVESIYGCAGIDLGKRNLGCNALHIASDPACGTRRAIDEYTSINSSVFEFILYRMKNLDALSSSGKSVLHNLVRYREAVLLGKLVRQGANIDVVDSRGNSGLMLAARSNFAYMANLLLDLNIDPEMKNTAGETAFDIAKRLGHNDIAELIGNPGDGECGEDEPDCS